MAAPEQSLRAWAEYLRDMGIVDMYRREPGSAQLPAEVLGKLRSAPSSGDEQGRFTANSSSTQAGQPRQHALQNARTGTSASEPEGASRAVMPEPASERLSFGRTVPFPAETLPSGKGARPLAPELTAPMARPVPLESLFAAPTEPLPAGDRVAALEGLRAEIGDCTRCPLAYAGRHTIVFGEGDPSARLMFVGEGPGADEDESGRPFVGKAGQLLNNMITAMGLKREQVYIANIVKCRPPGNRTPEFAEASVCSQFLLKQIDIVRPQVLVALGSTAATYLLGVKQSLASLRGQWHTVRDAKVAVTYHPAFLLRDPRQKSEAWKDLQRVMAELGLEPAGKAS